MYYVDRFTMEIVTEKDEFSPPERYYEYREGVLDDIFIETYIVSYSPLQVINFAYRMDDPSMVSIERDMFFKEHGLPRNLVLYAYTVPKALYEHAIKTHLNKLKTMGLDASDMNGFEVPEEAVAMSDYDIYFDWEQSSDDLSERYKTCGRCIHDGDCPDIAGSYCYNCKRNPNDHRIDWFEAKKD